MVSASPLSSQVLQLLVLLWFWARLSVGQLGPNRKFEGGANFVYSCPPERDQLQVSYRRHRQRHYIRCGEAAEPWEVRQMPSLNWPAAEADGLYTVLMYDPDEPAHEKPSLAAFLHLIIGNVAGEELHVEMGIGHVLPGRAENLEAWLPAGPRPGTGPHRFVFEVYRQPMDWHLTFDGHHDWLRHKDSRIPPRARFNPTKWAAEVRCL